MAGCEVGRCEWLSSQSEGEGLGLGFDSLSLSACAEGRRPFASAISAEKSESTATASPAVRAPRGFREGSGESSVEGPRSAVAEEERLVCLEGAGRGASGLAWEGGGGREGGCRLERAREGVTVVHRPQQRLLPQVGADALQHRLHTSQRHASPTRASPADDPSPQARVDRVLDHALRLQEGSEKALHTGLLPTWAEKGLLSQRAAPRASRGSLLRSSPRRGRRVARRGARRG